MLLLMIDKEMPIDIVLFADTGMEFPEMYAHLEKLDAYLYEKRGIHITILRAKHSFEYLMFDEPKVKPKTIENRIQKGIPLHGNGWPGIRVRWCTGQLKTHLISKEVNRLKGELGAVNYVGIAADEAWRCAGEKYPLVEWGITEEMALQICYDHGFDFGGLYQFNAETIYHFRVDNNRENICVFLSEPLLKHQGTLIYSYPDSTDFSHPNMKRRMELWILDDLTPAVISAVKITDANNNYTEVYRTVRTRNLDEIPREINISPSEFVEELKALNDAFRAVPIPFQEL